MASSSNTGRGSGLNRRRNAPPEIKIIPRDKIIKKPFRRSPSTPYQSEAGNKHKDVTDYSDTERFARTAALMAMHGDEINEYGSAIHLEFRRQIDSGKGKDASETINSHLGNLIWHEPPISPILTGSSAATPSSASSTTRRNRFVGRELRNKEFKLLLEQDRKFHALMNDLAGLREWWASNRAE
ncbi:hypothetical protein L207DRAFT_533201 [Hyaloscypha variabilis F]|uniref:Uncharacterized protein n=1 Tax=Hyaloscypha variabilis (strain UAMH 11265 / GT02V1 / F) TaxID=1149755 RepID=A0A2J6RCW0_HYAVF|nr:hypothetical protein L207DRAFT_533201 [Hyaloscypha variabilis F]